MQNDGMYGNVWQILLGADNTYFHPINLKHESGEIVQIKNNIILKFKIKGNLMIFGAGKPEEKKVPSSLMPKETYLSTDTSEYVQLCENYGIY